jgi:inner membrane protein
MNRNPLLSKVLMICFLALLLLVPLIMIQSKISERQALQHQVQQDIARSASGPQTLTGPYLVIKYKLNERKVTKDAAGNEKFVMVSTDQETTVMPHNLKVDGKADVETRSRGIYQARLFNLHSTIAGEFSIPPGYSPLGNVTPEAVYFVMRVSDSRGIRNVPVLTFNGDKYEFSPGSIGNIQGNGVHVQLKGFDFSQSHTFKFEFPLELQGMTTLAVAPSGNNTEMSLTSTWLHPSFGGAYLPHHRVVDDKGFNAQWQVTNLARNTTAQSAGNPQAEAEHSLSNLSTRLTFI